MPRTLVYDRHGNAMARPRCLAECSPSLRSRYLDELINFRAGLTWERPIHPLDWEREPSQKPRGGGACHAYKLGEFTRR